MLEQTAQQQQEIQLNQIQQIKQNKQHSLENFKEDQTIKINNVEELFQSQQIYEQQQQFVNDNEIKTTQKLFDKDEFQTTITQTQRERREVGVNSPRQRATNRKKQYSQPVTAPIHRRYDVVWQDNPARVLKYRPSFLHQFGWLPFFSILNIQATVMSDPFLHIQTLLLVGLMLLIHLTGLWLPQEDLRGFVNMFSTSYLGSIWNASMIVTFLLGLFVSEVYRRWWEIRTMYARLSSTTIDLCEMVTNMIRNPNGNPSDQRHINRARTELVRYLNLGHMLVITTAASQRRRFRRHPLSRKAKQVFHPGRTAKRRYEAKNLSYDQLNQAGLVNWDEWELMERCEGRGMPRYLTVYHWTQQLINKVKASGWLWNSQMLPPMTRKLSTIVESGQGIFTFINSQLPYPYVHLVSMVTHLYLILLAVYMGAILHVGLKSDKITVNFSTTVELTKEIVEVTQKVEDPTETDVWQNATRDNGLRIQVQFQEGLPLKEEYFSATWLYLVLCVVNVVLQGMLMAHSLFDNPFGSHPSKFPLRLMATELINVTRSLLKGADDLPQAFNDIFLPQNMSPCLSPSTSQRDVQIEEDLFSEVVGRNSLNSGDTEDPTPDKPKRLRVDFINPRSSLGQGSIVWGSMHQSYSSHSLAHQNHVNQNNKGGRQLGRQFTLPAFPTPTEFSEVRQKQLQSVGTEPIARRLQSAEFQRMNVSDDESLNKIHEEILLNKINSNRERLVIDSDQPASSSKELSPGSD